MNYLSKLVLFIGLIFLITVNPAITQEEDMNDVIEDDKAVIEQKKKKEKIKSIKTSNEIVITATKSEIKKNQTGASITIITEDDIKQSGKKTVREVLRYIPGLTVRSSSVFGGESKIYIRGAKSEYVLVLIDGVEVNDPVSTNRSFDFSHMLTDNIERIEVIRGPQSVLYGSDSSGGVINIITKKGKGTPQINLSFEGGSNYTFSESLSVSGSNDYTDYSVSLSHLSSGGISRVAKKSTDTQEPEKDAYSNITVSTRLGVTLPAESMLNFTLHYTDIEMDADDGDMTDDSDHKNFEENLKTKIEFKHNPFSLWSYRVILSHGSINRRDQDYDDSSNFINSWFEGKTRKAEWQNIFSLGEIDDITAGIEIEQDIGNLISYWDAEFDPPPPISEMKDKKVYNFGYYLQNHLKLLDSIFFIAGVRIDDHQEYGTDFNYNLSLSYILPFIKTRLKGNYGTGFKAPSLYQLYDPTYGATSLEPEESKSYDIGFEQGLLDETIVLEGTFFHNNFKNKIGFEASKYTNIGEVETLGCEVNITVSLLDFLNIIANYTYTKTEDKSTGERQMRMPENTGSITVNWGFLPGGNINLSCIYVGERDDAWWDEFYTQHDVTMGHYYRIDLAASYRITDNFQVLGRIVNLTNNEYQETYGYATPGISFYGGLNASF